jgi:hypothetical protein
MQTHGFDFSDQPREDFGQPGSFATNADDLERRGALVPLDDLVRNPL